MVDFFVNLVYNDSMSNKKCSIPLAIDFLKTYNVVYTTILFAVKILFVA